MSVSLLLRQRALIIAMARREVFDRYAGQMFGVLWAIAHPLIVIGVYLFIFNVVLRVRIGSTAALPMDYPVYLLSGVIPWLTIAEILNKSGVTIVANASLVKQVVFPVEVLPVKTVLAAMPGQLAGLVVLVIYVLAVHRTLPWTYLFLPALLALQFVFMAGLAMGLAALGVFVRDLKDLVQVFTVIGVYLLPILYLPAMVPESVRPLLYLNPFSYLIWCYQDVLFFGAIRHPTAWIVALGLCVVSFAGGWRLFQRLRPAFGNAL